LQAAGNDVVLDFDAAFELFLYVVTKIVEKCWQSPVVLAIQRSTEFCKRTVRQPT